MKTLVILTHPYIENSRINKTFMNEAINESNITYMDLYKTYGDKPIDVLKEHERLTSYDRIIFQFPFFWYSCPSLLKAYIDAVVSYGFAYGPNGDKLENKEFMMCVSTGGTKDKYEKYTVDDCLRPIELTARYCRMKVLPTYAFHGAPVATDEEVKEGAKRFLEHIKKEY